ncbi:unnamed protein product [Prunus armeniaca]
MMCSTRGALMIHRHDQTIVESNTPPFWYDSLASEIDQLMYIPPRPGVALPLDPRVNRLVKERRDHLIYLPFKATCHSITQSLLDSMVIRNKSFNVV